MGLRIASEHPPGLIGIVSSTMGRYREFDQSLNNTEMPKMSGVTWELNIDVAFSFNNLCRTLLKNEQFQWLWILGDDHTFKRNTLMSLLKRNVDIVTPFCLQSTPPYQPLVFKVEDGKHFRRPLTFFDYKKGMQEVDACGNAGMLIKRSVIETIGDDWHRTGWIDPDRGSSDLYFCKKAREAGFKIYIDLDNPIGHIMHMATWPVRDINVEYSVGMGQSYEYPEEIHNPHANIFNK